MRTWTYIATCAVLLSVWTAGSEEAFAARKYRVDIRSEPEGATVWIDDRAGEPRGTTPLKTRLTSGSHTIYIELNGFEAVTREIDVGRRGNRIDIKLVEVQTGSIDVFPARGDDASDSATVFLDGEEVGTVPDSFDVEAGEHELEVAKEGFQTFVKTVTVARGKSVEVFVTLTKEKPPDPPKPPPPPKTRPAVATRPAISPFSVGASLGAGLRFYRYVEEPDNFNLRPFETNNLPIAIVELAAELRLGGLSSARWLRMFSLFGTATLSLPTTSSTEGQDQDISTTWFRHDAGLRTQFTFGTLWLAVDLAEGGDILTFSNFDGLDDELPELHYEYIRLGASFGLEVGENSFAIGGDGLLPIFVSGIVRDAFADSSVYGFRLHGHYRRILLQHIEATVATRFFQYAHNFTAADGQDAPDGAYDRIFDAIVTVGYRF